MNVTWTCEADSIKNPRIFLQWDTSITKIFYPGFQSERFSSVCFASMLFGLANKADPVKNSLRPQKASAKPIQTKLNCMLSLATWYNFYLNTMPRMTMGHEMNLTTLFCFYFSKTDAFVAYRFLSDCSFHMKVCYSSNCGTEYSIVREIPGKYTGCTCARMYLLSPLFFCFASNFFHCRLEISNLVQLVDVPTFNIGDCENKFIYNVTIPHHIGRLARQ